MTAVLSIDYVELSCPDLLAMKGFYAAAFGWRFADFGPAYAGVENAGLDGGFATTPASEIKAPLVILRATDLEAAEASVLAAGGRVTMPIFDFPGGRRFHFADPAGNELAVWSDCGKSPAIAVDDIKA